LLCAAEGASGTAATYFSPDPTAARHTAHGPAGRPWACGSRCASPSAAALAALRRAGAAAAPGRTAAAPAPVEADGAATSDEKFSLLQQQVPRFH
jgi:hypothetical protein